MNKLNAPIGSVNIIYPNGKSRVQKLSLSKSISCTGLDIDSRHPKVFISLKNGETKCPYCGIIFQKKHENVG